MRRSIWGREALSDGGDQAGSWNRQETKGNRAARAVAQGPWSSLCRAVDQEKRWGEGRMTTEPGLLEAGVEQAEAQ